MAALASGLYLFVLALELLKRGASGLLPLLRVLDVDGVSGGLGFGWLGACLLLSGSPVAAIALALLAGGALTTLEAFAMIGGSRLGASFVVLVLGAADDWRAGRHDGRAAYVGATALLATAAIYVPALACGYLALDRGLLSGLVLEGRALDSLLRPLFGVVAAAAAARLPTLALFGLGLGALLAGFRLLDLALPDLSGERSPLERMGKVVLQPFVLFLVGAGITCLTLSVSVSISLLVPLTSRGWVRRENVWPYVCGANVTTLIDTLLAGALVGHPDAVRIVALQMLFVALLSLPVVLVFPHAFGYRLDRLARLATGTPRARVAFVGVVLVIPALLLGLG